MSELLRENRNFNENRYENVENVERIIKLNRVVYNKHNKKYINFYSHKEIIIPYIIQSSPYKCDWYDASIYYEYSKLLYEGKFNSYYFCFIIDGCDYDGDIIKSFYDKIILDQSLINQNNFFSTFKKKLNYMYENKDAIDYFNRGLLEHFSIYIFKKGNSQDEMYFKRKTPRYDLDDVILNYENRRLSSSESEEESEEEVNQNENKTFKSEQCVICISNKPSVLFCSCGHLCLCDFCFKIYDNDQCPICKTKNKIIRKL